MLPRMLIGLLTVPFFILGFYCIIKHKPLKTEFGQIWVGVSLTTLAYFFYELNVITTEHDYYMMPFLPSIFVVVTYGIKQWQQTKFGTHLMLILFLLVSPLTAFLTVNNYWNIEQSSINADVIKYKDDLRKAVPFHEKCIILNDYSSYIFSYLIDKQGFMFANDNLPVIWIDDMVKNYNVHYMYSDSRKVDENIDFQPYIDSVIIQRGSVKVFKLKIPQK
jgi:hypothetical protein